MIIEYGTTFNLGSLEKLIKGLPDSVLIDMGKAGVTRMCARIWENSEMPDGSAIDLNRPGWIATKRAKGHSVKPLVMTGEMTTVKAWNVDIKGDYVVVAVKSEHYEKWDTIMEYCQERNWKGAYEFGTGEIQAMTAALHLRVLRELGLEEKVRVKNDKFGIPIIE